MLSRAGAAAAAVLFALTGTALSGTAGADDVRDSQSKIMRTLDVPSAWRLTKGKGVTVGLVDSGVDANQPDLKGSVTTGPNFIKSTDGDTKPKRQHGTMMASLIAGHGHGSGGGSGIIGIAPESRIVAVRGIAEKEDPGYRAYQASARSDESLADAIRYTVDHGADVINLSLGNYVGSPVEREAVAYAIGRGVVVVSAVGNDGDARRKLDKDGFAPYFYPASFPGVIAVAATDEGHAKAKFSTRNYSVLLSAPGSQVPVAGPGKDGYFISAGTSDASALVSGIAALIRARHPKLAPALVSQALLASTRFGPKGTYDPSIGFGEVNAARALAASDRIARPPSDTLSSMSGGQHFGEGEQGPVAVIDRPLWLRLGVVGITLAGVAGSAAAIAVLVLLYRSTAPGPLQPVAFAPPPYATAAATFEPYAAPGPPPHRGALPAFAPPAQGVRPPSAPPPPEPVPAPEGTPGFAPPQAPGFTPIADAAEPAPPPDKGDTRHSGTPGFEPPPPV